MLSKAKTAGKIPAGKIAATQEFAVIGLGHFGASLARRLEQLGHTVLGVDNELARVQANADALTAAVAFDATNEDALAEVDITAFQTVVVAIDDDFESAALITAYLKGHAIPTIICLAKSYRHREILQRIGADQVIMSDEDSGARLAETLALPDVVERALLDANHSLVELKTPARLVGKTAADLGAHDATLLLIQRGSELLPNPGPATRLAAGDTLFVVGPREPLLQLAAP